MKKRLTQILGVVLTSRPSIVLFNLIIVVISTLTIYHAARLLATPANDYNEIELMLDGIGTILIAYGVAIEERASLLKFFKLCPLHEHVEERFENQTCHFYGLLLLILGLLMETTVQAVKLPNRILNTEGLEGVIFGIGVFFCSIAVALLCRASQLLVTGAAGEDAPGG
ncbi:MAG: hypothetical protein NTY77_17650 [Elusimicrobia bacterium]|nr:hypothetical protein [Elusimicrobiota bacterium]